MGVDETRFLAVTKDHRRIYATGMVDLRRGILLEVIEGRSAKLLADWLAARPTDWPSGVGVVTIDPLEAYRNGLSPSLDHVLVVADPFHVVLLANRAIDEVRRRTQNALTGHRGRKGDPLYDIRKILLTADERLTARARVRLDTALAAGDPRDEVLASWLAKEHLREVYAVDDPGEAGIVLDAVLEECSTSEVPELRRLRGTLRRWRSEILNHHRTGDSNGPTEAMNLLIKKITRAGCGFTNFQHYRLRLLAHCGLQSRTHRAASMRGRSPPLGRVAPHFCSDRRPNHDRAPFKLVPWHPGASPISDVRWPSGLHAGLVAPRISPCSPASSWSSAASGPPRCDTLAYFNMPGTRGRGY
jgi:hypothetical protein